jgi:hypothetical protein
MQLDSGELHHFAPFLGFVEVNFPNSGGVIEDFTSYLPTESFANGEYVAAESKPGNGC